MRDAPTSGRLDIDPMDRCRTQDFFHGTLRNLAKTTALLRSSVFSSVSVRSVRTNFLTHVSAKDNPVAAAKVFKLFLASRAGANC